MGDATEFRADLRRRFDTYVAEQARRFPREDLLRVDLHCHDRNSDEPDQALGRLIGARETWLPTADLLAAIRRAHLDVPTVTNHNDARSCWELREQGEDVLVSAEFTCFEPIHEVWIHVLTYGFDAGQQQELLRRRHDLYRFLEYAVEQDLPTSWAHPLYIYGRDGRQPDLSFFERLSLVFERFEVVNGHRDAWQNMLWAEWLGSLDEERIDALAHRHRLPADRYCRRPFVKAHTGGSDCHMGLFVGTAGTALHVPDLRAKLAAGKARSQLALDALRRGASAPFGRYSDHERIGIAFLDWFCQAQMFLEDRGLLRLALHKGTPREKLLAFAVANGLVELRRHRYTSRFVETAHGALHGKAPGFLTRQVTFREYRPILDELDAIARSFHEGGDAYEAAVTGGMHRIFSQLGRVFAGRVQRKLEEAEGREGEAHELRGALDRFELPLFARSLGGSEKRALPDWLDGLPFPALATGLLGASGFASAHAMFSNRRVLDGFAERLSVLRHPRRALWLTDTLFDQNGVSRSLGLKLREVRRRDLPIDFLTCAPPERGGDHLSVLDPLAEITLPLYPDMPLRPFDLLALQRRFVDGGYDRIVCSTEFPMGAAALFLKHAFHVPAYFYLHTDWLSFGRDTLGFDRRELDRLRRMLRALYSQFDGIFVLNQEQAEWLSSDAIGIPAERVFRTAHWVDPIFAPGAARVAHDRPIVLYAGRLSKEKGVADLARLLARVRERVPDATLLVAGDGPLRAELQRDLPDAHFTGWVDAARLAGLYRLADVAVLPSRFDTFSCAVLEALASGLPVVAYGALGPKDLIEHGRSGYLVEDVDGMAACVANVLSDPEIATRLSTGALARAACFGAEPIMDGVLAHIGLGPRAEPRVRRPAPFRSAEA